MLSPREKMGRASWTLHEAIKDSVVNSISLLFHEGQLKLDKNQVRSLEDLLKRSIEAGYHRAYASFMKEVDAALALNNPVEDPAKKNKRNRS